MSELKVLQPTQELTLSTGEVIQIKPLPFGKLAKAIGLMTSIFTNASLGYDALKSDSTTAASIISKILIDGGEEVYSLLTLGIGKDRAWFDELPMDDGVKLTSLFLEVNADFFIRQVLPALRDTSARIKGMKVMAS